MTTIVIWLFFAASDAPVKIERDCKDTACVFDMVKRAENDPAVFHYQVLVPGDQRVVLSGVPCWTPTADVWKQ